MTLIQRHVGKKSCSWKCKKKFVWKQIKSFPSDPLRNFITQFLAKQFSNSSLFSLFIVDFKYFSGE